MKAPTHYLSCCTELEKTNPEREQTLSFTISSDWSSTASLLSDLCILWPAALSDYLGGFTQSMILVTTCTALERLGQVAKGGWGNWLQQLKYHRVKENSKLGPGRGFGGSVVVEPGPWGLLARPHPHLQPQAAEPRTFAKLFADSAQTW